MVSVETCPKCGSATFRTADILRQNKCTGEYETKEVYKKCNQCHHSWETPGNDLR